MTKLILFLLLLFSTQTLFANDSLNKCVDEASHYTLFRQDAKTIECRDRMTNVDDCITVVSHLSRPRKDSFLSDYCINLSKSREECLKAADYGQLNKDDLRDSCNKKFPLGK